MPPEPTLGPSAPPTFYRTDVLVAGLLLAMGYWFLAWLQVSGPALAVIGAPMLFFVPGYAVGSMVFRTRPHLSLAADFAVTIGFSVVFNGLVGLLLLELHAGLNLFFLANAIVILCLLSVLLILLSPAERVEYDFGPFLRRELGLTQFSPRLRAIAFALLASILLATVGLFYVASLHPSETPVASLLLSSNRTGGSLPTTAAVGQSIGILVALTNGPDGGNFTLSIRAQPPDSTPTQWTPVGWAMPLRLGPDRIAEDPIYLGAGAASQVPVEILFPLGGAYLIEFTLASTGGIPVANETLPLTVG